MRRYLCTSSKTIFAFTLQHTGYASLKKHVSCEFALTFCSIHLVKSSTKMTNYQIHHRGHRACLPHFSSLRRILFHLHTPSKRYDIYSLLTIKVYIEYHPIGHTSKKEATHFIHLRYDVTYAI